MTDERFTLRDLNAYSALFTMATTNAKVARLVKDTGRVVYGEARYICSGPNAGFPSSDDDVRNCYLRVTTSGGFEAWWPLAELALEIPTGEFCQYNWSTRDATGG